MSGIGGPRRAASPTSIGKIRVVAVRTDPSPDPDGPHAIQFSKTDRSRPPACSGPRWRRDVRASHARPPRSFAGGAIYGTSGPWSRGRALAPWGLADAHPREAALAD